MGAITIFPNTLIEWFVECRRMADILRKMEPSSEVELLKGHLIILSRSITKEMLG